MGEGVAEGEQRQPLGSQCLELDFNIRDIRGFLFPFYHSFVLFFFLNAILALIKLCHIKVILGLLKE